LSHLLFGVGCVLPVRVDDVCMVLLVFLQIFRGSYLKNAVYDTGLDEMVIIYFKIEFRLSAIFSLIHSALKLASVGIKDGALNAIQSRF